jgi:hypothetical protein
MSELMDANNRDGGRAARALCNLTLDDLIEQLVRVSEIGMET